MSEQCPECEKDLCVSPRTGRCTRCQKEWDIDTGEDLAAMTEKYEEAKQDSQNAMDTMDEAVRLTERASKRSERRLEKYESMLHAASVAEEKLEKAEAENARLNASLQAALKTTYADCRTPLAEGDSALVDIGDDRWILPKPVAEELARQAEEIKRLQEIVDLIEKFRNVDGTVLEIIYAYPDFDETIPDYVLDVSNCYHGDGTKRVGGETFTEALKNAWAALSANPASTKAEDDDG